MHDTASRPEGLSALERLQDLLARATKGRWRAAAGARGELVLDEDGQLVAGPGAYGLRTGRSNARLIALAPVLASDLIALAEAVTRERQFVRVQAMGGRDLVGEAISTVLAHIDDSLPAPATSLEGDA